MGVSGCGSGAVEGATCGTAQSLRSGVGRLFWKLWGVYVYEFGLGFFWRLIINSFVLVIPR